MNVLKSYSFGLFCGVNQIPSEVLSLFTELVEKPESRCTVVSEILVNGLKGRIDCEHDFCMKAYETTIKKNEMLHKNTDKQKQVYIDYNVCAYDECDYKESKNSISVEQVNKRVLEKIKGAYDDFENDDELKYAISFIKELQPVIFVEENMDLIGAIKKAIEGKTESVNKLKEICAKYEVLAEQIYIVLQSGFSFEECFAL